MVLFKIKPRHVPLYAADCVLWEKEARRHKGFLDYRTLTRVNGKNHHASFYVWKAEKYHKAFMRKHHDRLVAMSRCPVEVLGYYNFAPLKLAC